MFRRAQGIAHTAALCDDGCHSGGRQPALAMAYFF